MAKEVTENIPDSHIVFLKKRIHDVRGYAETKFGKSFICINVNRTDERFDVIVKDDVDKSDKKEFEELWTMCKVFTAIS